MIDHGAALRKEPLFQLASQSNSQAQRAADARAWVEAARRAGLDPRIVQQPLSSPDAGEWHIATVAPSTRLVLPEHLWDEVFMILVADSDFATQPSLDCWHGTVLLDDTSPRAIALRLWLAQKSLKLSLEDFHAPIARDARQIWLLHSEIHLSRLCLYHGIPEEWLTSGEPAEIEKAAGD